MDWRSPNQSYKSQCVAGAGRIRHFLRSEGRYPLMDGPRWPSGRDLPKKVTHKLFAAQKDILVSRLVLFGLWLCTERFDKGRLSRSNVNIKLYTQKKIVGILKRNKMLNTLTSFLLKFTNHALSQHVNARAPVNFVHGQTISNCLNTVRTFSLKSPKTRISRAETSTKN